MCGESRPEALIAGSNPMLCAECKRRTEGKKTSDAHHVAGEANTPVTVSLPTNDHRAELSVAQMDWPRRTLENPRGSPILAGAASERGFTDTTQYLLERLLYPNPEMLETLDAFLEEILGPEWWVGTPMEKYAPKR